MGLSYEAFTAPEFRTLLAGRDTPYWDSMLESPAVVECKLRRSQYVLEQIVPGRILDYGSGMGFLSCYLARHTAEVVGVELVEGWRDSSEYLAEHVFGVSNIRFVETDNELEAASFDTVVMCNAVSHIARLTFVLGRAYELLKPSGMIFIEDNNNRRSVVVRRRQKGRWNFAEHQYRKIRLEIDTGREDATYGMNEAQIELWRGQDLSALRRLREFAPVDPKTGIYHENWFTPRELEVMLFNTGFAPVESRAKYVFDYKKNAPVSRLFQTFPRLSLFVAPAFEVRAVKV
jgi:2-polyprenyl-3-methyl-5-hydroxy-6-metoxy-1,4-benzoquinol methylase